MSKFLKVYYFLLKVILNNLKKEIFKTFPQRPYLLKMNDWSKKGVVKDYIYMLTYDKNLHKWYTTRNADIQEILPGTLVFFNKYFWKVENIFMSTMLLSRKYKEGRILQTSIYIPDKNLRFYLMDAKGILDIIRLS